MVFNCQSLADHEFYGEVDTFLLKRDNSELI